MKSKAAGWQRKMALAGMVLSLLYLGICLLLLPTISISNKTKNGMLESIAGSHSVEDAVEAAKPRLEFLHNATRSARSLLTLSVILAAVNTAFFFLWCRNTYSALTISSTKAQEDVAGSRPE